MKRMLPLLALAVLVLGGLDLFGLHALRPLESRLLDSLVQAQAAKLPPDPEIVLVQIDERSLAAMQDIAGRFPWPRDVYADLIKGLEQQKPRAVVFDIMFIETASQYDNLYFPLVRLDAREDPNGASAAEFASALGLVRSAAADPQARIAVIPPLVLPQKLWRTGSINFLADPDGVGRRYFLRHDVRGWRLPSLPARLAMDLGFPLPDADTLLLAWRGEQPRVSFSDLYADFNRAKRVRPR